jgi:hypothetical protein
MYLFEFFTNPVGPWLNNFVQDIGPTGRKEVD